MTNCYMLALPIEDMSVGQKYHSLPLHCTLIRWFTPRLKIPGWYLSRCLSDSFNCPPLTLVPGGRDDFGPNNDVKVTLVQNNPALHFLHGYLFAETGRLANKMDWRWQGAHYRPHVSDCGGRAWWGEVLADKIFLIRKDDDMKYILASASLLKR